MSVHGLLVAKGGLNQCTWECDKNSGLLGIGRKQRISLYVGSQAYSLGEGGSIYGNIHYGNNPQIFKHVVDYLDSKAFEVHPLLVKVKNSNNRTSLEVSFVLEMNSFPFLLANSLVCIKAVLLLLCT